jgi:hypothetical protein
MKRLAVLVAAIGLVSSPVSAGMFKTDLSDADAHQIKRLAVISVLGDTLHAKQISLTAFQNKGFDTAVPNWGLDTIVMNALKEIVVASGKITGEVVPFAVSPSADMKTIIALARGQGFDTVLVVLPEANPHADYIAPGAMLLRRKLPGVDKLYACNGMAASMIRIVDDKRIGYAFPGSCSERPNAPVWHDSWADFTDDEKKDTLDAIQSYIKLQVREALSTMNIRAPRV